MKSRALGVLGALGGVVLGGGVPGGMALHAQSDCAVLVWSEEFEGNALDLSRWEIQTGTGAQYGLNGWGNNELQYYTGLPDNLSVGDGALRITARNQGFGEMDYTSARIRTAGMAAFATGRIEARIRVPKGQGIWPAFWMLPEENRFGGWAVSGELDIMEVVGHEPWRAHGTIHHGGSYPCNSFTGQSIDGPDLSEDFHVYAVEWEEDEIRWFLDDIQYAVQTPQTTGRFWPFVRPFHLLLNVAVGGNWPGSPDGSTVFPQTMEVDYVRVYQSEQWGMVTGRRSVQGGSLLETYRAPEFPEGTYVWSVDGGTLVSGQGTPAIEVRWDLGVAEGSVVCTATGAECSAQWSVPVQVMLPDDGDCIWEVARFEAGQPDAAAWSCGAGAISVVTNTNATPFNPSARCLQYVRSGDPADRVSFATDAISDATAFSTGALVWAVDVFTNAPVGTEIRLALEKQGVATPTGNAGRHSHYTSTTTGQYAWGTLFFSYLGSPDAGMAPGTVNQVTLVPDPGGPWVTSYFFDNLRVVDAACVPVGVQEPTAAAPAAPCRVWVAAPGLLAFDCVDTGPMAWELRDLQGRLVQRGQAVPGTSHAAVGARGPLVIRWETGSVSTLWMP